MKVGDLIRYYTGVLGIVLSITSPKNKEATIVNALCEDGERWLIKNLCEVISENR